MKLYQRIASSFEAYLNCCNAYLNCCNEDWKERHREAVNKLCREELPSGAGIDGTSFNWRASRNNRLVLDLSYHHMDQGGGYDGWTIHSIVVEPDLVFGMRIKIRGSDRNKIKDYLGEIYREALMKEPSDA